MAGISNTGLGLPSAASLFGNASGTAPATPPAAATTTTTAAVDPNAQQPGVLVQGEIGSTTLPAAAPADFQSDNPTPLDQPHPTWPTLIASHVAVLQAIGTPEAIIGQLAASKPQAEWLDRYIQSEIMQNPEGWDSYTGDPAVAQPRPAGTARAGLQQLIPGVQLPAAGQGNPGYMPDGTPASGINVPGLSTPLLDPATGAPQGDGGMVKMLLFGAAAIGIGLLGWKFMKNRNAQEPMKLAVQGFAGGAEGAALGGGLNSFEALGRQLMGAGVDAKDFSLVQRGLTLTAMGGGGAAGASAANAATAFGVVHGLAPGTGSVMANHAAARFAGISDTLAHKIAMDNRWADVLEQLARNGGTLGDAATAGVLASQAMGTQAASAASAGGTHLAGLRQLLTGVANSLA